MTRVASYAQHTRLTAFMTDTQLRLGKTQIQIASGQKAQEYSGISADAGRLVSLEVSQARVTQYIADIDTVERRLNTMETSVGAIFDVMTEFRTLLVNGLNANNAADLDLVAQASLMLDQITGLLNVEDDGRYLFSGSRTDTAPVDQAGLPAAYVVPTTDGDSIGYYQGDAQQAVLRADDGFDVTYGVTADQPAFEQAIRALHLVMTGGPTDRATLEHALGVSNQAIQGIPDIRTRIGTARETIADTLQKHEDYLVFAEKTIGDIAYVDVTAAMSQLANEEVSLQASYMALSRMAQLNLMNFLS